MSLRTLRTNAYLIERPVFVDSLIFNRSNIAKCELERWRSGVDVPGYAIDPGPMWAEFDGSGGASTNGLRQWTNFGQVVGLAIVSAFRTALDATWVAYALHLPLLYHAAVPQTTSTTQHSNTVIKGLSVSHPYYIRSEVPTIKYENILFKE